MVKRSIILAACLPILLSACGGNVDGASHENPLPAGADMVLSDGVRFVEAVDGVQTWEITSKGARYSTATGLLQFNDVEAAYFQKGERAYDVSGKEGRYDSKQEIIYLTGDVAGRSADGYTLKTESLKYNLKTETAETEDRVEIRGDGLEIDGVGMLADFRKETFTVLDSTRVWVLPAKIPK